MVFPMVSTQPNIAVIHAMNISKSLTYHTRAFRHIWDECGPNSQIFLFDFVFYALNR